MPPVTRVIPLLVCDDIQATHDFLVTAFGFETGGVQRDGEGRPIHGEVTSGDAVIWLHAVSPEHELAAPASLPAASSGLVIHVEDVDAHYEHAVASGAQIDSAPVDQEYGQREYGARDPEGHRWWFATPIVSD